MKMKFTQFKWLVTMLLLVTAMAMPKMAWAEIKPKQPSGKGTADSPYQIGDAEELYWFAGLVNGTLEGETQNTSANAVLTKNITVNNEVLISDVTLNNNGSGFETWTPIGKNLKPYTGTFDGKGHTISGLYFNDSSAEYVGLFGYNNGTIKNVGVVDSYFYGYNYVGGVCGANYGTITGCYNTGTVSGTLYNVGGVCGRNYGTITGCYNTGTISGNQYVGGVCGYNDDGTITGCYNTGSVSGKSHVGGVCGENDGTITGCYNTGTVSGTLDNVGGVCGYNIGTITGCYNTGSVSGRSYVGGVCGHNFISTTGCYNTGSVSGSSYVGGVCGYNSIRITGCYNIGEVSGSSNVGGVCGYNEGSITGCYTNNRVVIGESSGTITDCEVKSDFTDGTVCSLLNTALNNANASVRFCQGANYPIINLPSLVGGVYQISNKEELYAFALLVNNGETPVNAVLTADITVNTGVLKEDGTLADNYSGFVTWTPMGNYQNPYTGTFDGQGHTISGLYFNDSSKERVGLFGYVDSGGKISNVGVLDSYFLFKMFGGGVCGTNEGEISNCYNFSTVVETSGNGFAGGVCGYNVGGKVLNSYNNGIISGITNTGGVCGYNQSNGEITNCYNSGTVSGKGETNQIAGVCGYNDSNCTISGCYNTGTVSGQNLGGVCGDNYGTVKNCYNTGTVDGQNVCGGVCSTNNSGTITSCYNRGVVNGTGGYVGGICGNIGSSSSTTNCYYDSKIYSGNAIGYIPGGTVDNVMGKTTAQFNSGEVCYLLNGSSPYGEWGQQLGTDNYPVLGDYKVIKAAKGDNNTYWATFSNQNSDATLSVPSPRDLYVYNATVSGGRLTLSERTDNQVAKGEGVLLKTDGEYVNAKANATYGLHKVEYANNNLVATPATEETKTADEGCTLYRLTYNNVNTQDKLGFYLSLVKDENGNVDNTSLGKKLKATPGKAYLKVSTEAATNPVNAALARSFVFPGDDETTGIGEIVIEGDAGISGSANANDRIYNLQGQQVTAPVKGLYIKNNKKVIIK